MKIKLTENKLREMVRSILKENDKNNNPVHVRVLGKYTLEGMVWTVGKRKYNSPELINLIRAGDKKINDILLKHARQNNKGK
jgi:hypothetical protein